MWDHIIGCCLALALGLLPASLPAEAQPQEPMPRIGWVGTTAPSGPSRNREAFEDGLREMGYHVGQHVVIESRYTERPNEGFAPLVADLLRLPVAALVTTSIAATRAAREATSTIPIVFTEIPDPVELGIVASLAQPGGNVTGMASLSLDLGEQKLTMLKAIVPGLTRVAWLVNPSQPGLARGRQRAEALAPQLGLHIQEWAVREPAELPSVFAALVRAGAEALSVLPDGLLLRHCPEIAALAATHRLPAVYGYRTCVEAGGLLSYATDGPARFRRAGVFVGKILRGTKPADLPVEQAMKFELVINLKAAQMLGLTVPPHLLVLADEVIR